MDSKSTNKYTVLVAGDVDLTQYDFNIKVSPYVIYEYSKRYEIHEQAKNVYKNLIKELSKSSINSNIIQILSMKLQDLEELSKEEYFEEITKGLLYDDKTGDALTNVNPNWKFKHIEFANEKYSMYLNDNKFECLVEDIIDKKPDKNNIEIYSNHWDYLMTCTNNIKDPYLKYYKTKDVYVSVMSSPFFYNAFVSNETGWLEQCDMDQIQWVLNFKKNFIDNLPKKTKLKVYNFIK